MESVAPVVGLVLAGGRATRMGGEEKTLLDVGGRPILARVLGALRAEVALLAISANGEPGRFASFGVPVLPDQAAHRARGPLAGLLAGLDWAAGLGAAALLTAPGDTPFLPGGLRAALWPAPSYAASGERDHHLVGLWPVVCRAALRAKLDVAGRLAVWRFGAEIGMRRVAIPTGPFDPFLNVNTPEDLAMARAMAGEAAH